MLSVSSFAIDVGGTLPPLKGEFLTGREAVLPGAAQGKPALLAIGFTYKSRFAVEEWVKHFRADFDKEPRATFFEVPIIGGMAKMGRWFIDSGMRRGTPKTDHEHVVTVYSEAGEWKKRLDFKAPDAAYLVLLDKDGKVAWTFTGGYDAARYTELATKVKELVSR
jgi:hypothetical protein